MKYMLAIYGDESAQENAPPEAVAANLLGRFKFDEQLRGTVELIHGSVEVRALELAENTSERSHLIRRLAAVEGP